MDTGETHIPERPSTRPVGSGPAPRTVGPEDPRTESPGKAARTRPAGAEKPPRASRSPRAKVASEATPETSDGPGSSSVTTSLLDDLASVEKESGPVEIPIIVPAEPDEPPDEHQDEPTTEATPQPRALPNPVKMRPRRPRVRRVTRVVRHVDTWSVFKVALVFNAFLYGVCVTAGVLLWQVAQNTGTVDNIERFFESNGWETFELHGGEIFHNAWVGGLFVVVGFTGLAVLMATMFNLITDLVGGIRVSVLEEEVVAREERGSGWRWPWARTAMPDPSSPPVAHADVAEPAKTPTDPA